MATCGAAHDLQMVKFELTVTTEMAGVTQEQLLAELSRSLEGSSLEVTEKRHSLRVSGGFQKAMDTIGPAYARVLRTAADAHLRIEASPEHTGPNARIEEAERESFPASDPPATNPGQASP